MTYSFFALLSRPCTFGAELTGGHLSKDVISVRQQSKYNAQSDGPWTVATVT